jgi:hypothetical protein
MIRMNCSPPRARNISSAARFPAVNARIRNSARSNIGSATRDSIQQKSARNATPPINIVSTNGDVHPIVWPPCGWMP